MEGLRKERFEAALSPVPTLLALLNSRSQVLFGLMTLPVLISLFTLALLHSLIFEGGFLNVGATVNKMGNSHETSEIKSLVLKHSFLYFPLV